VGRPKKRPGKPQPPINLTKREPTWEINGKSIHKWTCMGCPWTHTEIGGRQALRHGNIKSMYHKCYNSEDDAQSERKDLK